MFKGIFCLLLLFISSILYSQSTNIKQSALGIHFFATDFKTAANIKARGFGEIFKTDVAAMRHGLSIGYLRGINNHVDLSINASGCFIDYPIPDRQLLGENNLLLQFSAMANLKLNTDRYWFTPFISGGTGVSKYKNYHGIILPAGLGFQFNYKQEIFVLLQSNYSFALTNNVNDYLIYSVGLAGNLKARKRKAAKLVPSVLPMVTNLDKDSDSVMDSEDRCPDVPGPAEFKGCPDMDADGIPDIDDNCPTVSGFLKYKGCPAPDADGDGIYDEDDKCPAVYGVLRYKGCPVPDSDNDGINDELDKCIADSGSIRNDGCPELDTIVIEMINKAASHIYFETGSAKLLSKSHQYLNEVAKVLNEKSRYRLSIEGHTDNTGKRSINQLLSEKRADAVKQYLVGKGLAESRITTKGFGTDKPIADNKTQSGKSQNRRVELKISY